MNPGSVVTGSDGKTYYVTSPEHLTHGKVPVGVTFEVDEEVILIEDGAAEGNAFRAAPAPKSTVKKSS